MKNVNWKRSSEEMIQEFLAKGGKITKCPPAMPKPYKGRPVGELIVVEIDTDALPPELRKYVKID